MQQKYFAFIFGVFLIIANAPAQNVSSPYSVLGIGDIETNDYGRYQASGGAAVSRREAGFYNFSNPASLTVMPYKAFNFNFYFRGRISEYNVPGSDTLAGPSKDMVLKNIGIAFKVTPTVAFAVGLKPFSSVNYQYITGSTTNDGDLGFLKYTDGSGGINQTYFSIAKQVNRRLSIGATVSWLFGAMQNSTTYISPLLSLDIIKTTNDFYNAAGLQSGIQYYSLPGKKWQHSLGLTATAYSKLKGQNTTEYIESTVAIKTLDPVNIQFEMPVSLSAGYSIAKNNGLSFHLQGSYQKWPTQRVNYKNSYTKDAYGLHAGMEYSKKITAYRVTEEKYYMAWGIKMEQYYLVINNQRLNDYAATIGGGINISRFLTVNTGIEVGRKGTSSLKQIQENYFQYSFGITLKDIWYGTKKFGRYN